MITLLKPFLIILLSLILGYFFGIFYEKRFTNIGKLRSLLQKIALLVLNPIAFLGAVWISPLRDIRLIAVPIVGGVALISGGVFTFLYCRIRKLDRISTGSLIPTGSFTNLGSIGGIIVFFFLGEAGFSFVPLYKLFEELIYFGIAFPIIKTFSNIETVEINRFKRIFKDPFIVIILIAIIIGSTLNFSGIERPNFYGVMNPFLISILTSLLLISVGMGFKFRKFKPYISHAIAISLIKTLLVPLVTISLAYFIGLGDIQEGLVLKVVIILSVMPAAVLSIIPATIYDLNLDMSNTVWLGSMLSLLYTMPLLALLL